MRPILVIGSLNMDLVARCRCLPTRGQTVFGDGEVDDLNGGGGTDWYFAELGRDILRGRGSNEAIDPL